MKRAMVDIWESGVCDELGAPHLTVHDELDGSLPDGPVAIEALNELRNIMQTCVQLKVPLVSDLALLTSWGGQED
jgi:DNA polymerase I-like protein with 3'-5' exonuclease and polymerase domains